MDLSTFIAAVFCLIDNRLKGRRIRSQGPAPKPSDAEVLGESFGLRYRQGHSLLLLPSLGLRWFPALGEVHRTTFSRQAATLWKVQERLWQELLAPTPRPGLLARRLDRPAACLFARAYNRCKRFHGEAAFEGHAAQADLLRVQGARYKASAGPASSPVFRWPSRRPRALRRTRARRVRLRVLVVGDRNYWLPKTKEELAKSMSIELNAPYRSKKRYATPERCAFLSQSRCRIDTVFSHLAPPLPAFSLSMARKRPFSPRADCEEVQPCGAKHLASRTRRWGIQL